MFDLQPTLKGKLITLRPMRPDDHDELYAAARDPLIWDQHPDGTRHTREGFKKYFESGLASGGALVAIDNATGEMIGSSRYHDYSRANDVVEVGWTFLARKFWGGQYNGEMKYLMLTHAYKFVGKAHFKVGPENIRSQKAVEKIGAVRIGTGIDGAGRESVVFELTREAFANGPLNHE